MPPKPLNPLRLRIQMALTDELAKITRANGYQHDLQDAVFRGRDAFNERDPLPMVSILESVDEKSVDGTSGSMKPGSAVRQASWELLVQGFVEDDRRNPTDPGYRLMADVQKRLAELRMQKSNILGFGSAVTDLQFTTGIVRPADEISGKAYFWLKVRMNVAEDHSDPYA